MRKSWAIIKEKYYYSDLQMFYARKGRFEKGVRFYRFQTI